MKLHMLDFIPEQQCAGVVQDRVVGARSNQPIVGGADQLRDEQNLNLESKTERVPDQPKESMGPVSSNRAAPKSDHQSFQQTRMFSFLGDEKLQRIQVHRIVADLPAGAIHQIGAAASLAELKMRERTR